MIKYDDTDIIKTLKENSVSTVNKSYITLYKDYQFIKTLNVSGSQVIPQLFDLISNSGSPSNSPKSPEVDLKVEFEIPLESSSRRMYFKDLKIGFKEYGKYQIIVAVDGIESMPSEVILYFLFLFFIFKMFIIIQFYF